VSLYHPGHANPPGDSLVKCLTAELPPPSCFSPSQQAQRKLSGLSSDLITHSRLKLKPDIGAQNLGMRKVQN